MTNYEWLLKEYPELCSSLCSGEKHLSYKRDEDLPSSCANVSCKNCLFYNDNKTCTEMREEWLKKEYVKKPKKVKVKIKDLSNETKEIICQSHMCETCPMFFESSINCIKRIDYEDLVHLFEKMDKEIEVEVDD